MKQETLQLTGGLGKESRRELDFYPTPPNCTIALFNFLEDKINKNNLIWEPACGSGEMIETIKTMGYTNTYGSDIRNTGYGVHDFINDTIDIKPSVIVTNPPFNLSELFITKAHSYNPDIVAMLVKSQYWHSKKRFNLFSQFPPAYILPLTWRPDFLNGSRGGSPTMEVLWTVWIKGDTQTKYQPLLKP